ncbi:hypothetical protein HDU86_003000 [Geranomyces michiganensis]|nr:hypothetical protein HDU86_003000 [Geranomyces michiganensis]
MPHTASTLLPPSATATAGSSQGQDDQLGAADNAKKPAKKFSKGFLSQRLRSLSSPPVPLPGLLDMPDTSGSTFGASGGSLPRTGSSSSRRSSITNSNNKNNNSALSSPVDSPLMERGGDHQPRGRRNSFGSLSLKRSASGPSSSGRGRDLQLTSAIVLLPEFKQLDTMPQRQRRLLIALERRSLLAAAKEKADRRKSGGGVREKLKNVRTSKDDKKGALSAKLQSLWKQKKSKRTRQEDFHLLLMAVHDHQSSAACSLLNEMSPSLFTKGTLTEANKVFMLAMANAMEPVCMIMMDKGFPADVNAPVLKSEDSPFTTPSYFMMTVGLRLHNLVFHMIQHHKVKVNADWYGITPLHVAACKGALTVVNMLLEHGANPRQGLSIANYRLLRRLKNTQPKDTVATASRLQSIARPRKTTGGSKRDSVMSTSGGGAGSNGSGVDPQPTMEEILPIDCASVWQDQEMVNALLSR